RRDAFLFGESQSRVIVSVSKENEATFKAFLKENDIVNKKLGEVTDGEIVLEDVHLGYMPYWKGVYDNRLGEIMEDGL
ncbi:MAG: phosphoribosylformylglycinamidine synthase subunit PurL, partial [Bacteroidota bacterium]